MSDNRNEYLDHPYRKQMELLCNMFPCLRGMAGTNPWDPSRLADHWALASSGEQAAIQFIISVWNHHGDHTPTWRDAWGFAPFTLGDFARLDDDNQRAVAAWFAAPFWP